MFYFNKVMLLLTIDFSNLVNSELFIIHLSSKCRIHKYIATLPQQAYIYNIHAPPQNSIF